MKQLILLICLLGTAAVCSSQDTVDCSVVKSGYFTYISQGEEMTIYRNGNIQHEWNEGYTSCIKGELTWDETCTYTAHITEVIFIAHPPELIAESTAEEIKAFEEDLRGILKSTTMVGTVEEVKKDAHQVKVSFMNEQNSVTMKHLSKKEGKKRHKRLRKILKKMKG